MPSQQKYENILWFMLFCKYTLIIRLFHHTPCALNKYLKEQILQLVYLSINLSLLSFLMFFLKKTVSILVTRTIIGNRETMVYISFPLSRGVKQTMFNNRETRAYVSLLGSKASHIH